MNPVEFAHTRLEHPEWIGASVSIIALTTLCVAMARLLARRRIRRVMGSGSERYGPTRSSDAALVIALIAICVALLGPNIGERTISIPDGGTDVVFLVDVSRSMDATDIPPTRLDQARRTLEEAIGRMGRGDRAALAIFAGRGLLLTPLTPDRNALLDLLADVGTGFIEPASSNIAAGIDSALAAFEAGSDRPRVIVVVSDGEDSRRSRASGATAATRQNARVVTVALGTEIGGHIPDSNGVLRDRKGNSVRTRRDADRLAELASVTGGQSFLGDEWGRVDFDLLAEAVGRDVASGEESAELRVGAVRVFPFAALAFAILLVEGFPWGGVRRNRRIASGIAVAMALLVAEGLLPTSAANGEDSETIPSSATIRRLEEIVRDSPEDARSRIDLGVAYLAIGSPAEAARAFLAASVHARDGNVASTAYFDLGVAALELGDPARARDAFFDALVLDPSDDSARFNLEWTLTILRKASAESTAPPGGSNESSRPETRAAPESGATKSAMNPTKVPDGAEWTLRLTAEERRQWLARVSDDSRQWLNATANEDGSRRDVARDPAW
jgi:Ca-activated chloride channel family protein